jgi:hypothetical protein
MSCFCLHIFGGPSIFDKGSSLSSLSHLHLKWPKATDWDSDNRYYISTNVTATLWQQNISHFAI